MVANNCHLCGVLLDSSVPFPFTIYASSKQLHNNMISSNQFLLCLLFPLPAVCYWLYKWCTNTMGDFKHEELPSQDVQHILQIMEGPFRKLNINRTNKNFRLPWEGCFTGRRLVLIFIKTFLINAFLRLSVMLLCTALVLIHHVHVRPFSSSVINKVETLSLPMLNIICSLNMVLAYNYTYPMYSYSHAQGVIQTLKVTETALNLVFPFLVALLVAIFTRIRVSQLIFWLCRCFVRFIGFFTKCKLP